MIILIAGASHTGKTLFAQKFLEKYHYPSLSIDHLKMGLIRSKNTELTPYSSDKELTAYLWNIVKEIIKTAIENEQNLIIEGSYIPFDWEKDFDDSYRARIQYCCLIMSEAYLQNHYQDVLAFANTIEKRLDDTSLTMQALIEENKENLTMCQKHGLAYILIEDTYRLDSDLLI